jgi:hypothetical protein
MSLFVSTRHIEVLQDGSITGESGGYMTHASINSAIISLSR